MLLAAAGSEGPKPEPRSFPDPAVSFPVLVVVSSPFLNKATFAQKCFCILAFFCILAQRPANRVTAQRMGYNEDGVWLGDCPSFELDTESCCVSLNM